MNTWLLHKADLTRLIYAWGSVGKTKGSEPNQVNEKDGSKGFCLIERAVAKYNHTSILTAGSPLPRMYVCSMYKLDGKAIIGMLEGDDGIDEVAE